MDGTKYPFALYNIQVIVPLVRCLKKVINVWKARSIFPVALIPFGSRCSTFTAQFFAQNIFLDFYFLQPIFLSSYFSLHLFSLSPSSSIWPLIFKLPLFLFWSFWHFFADLGQKQEIWPFFGFKSPLFWEKGKKIKNSLYPWWYKQKLFFRFFIIFRFVFFGLFWANLGQFGLRVAHKKTKAEKYQKSEK